VHVLALAVLRDPGLQLGILNFWQGLLLDVQHVRDLIRRDMERRDGKFVQDAILSGYRDLATGSVFASSGDFKTDMTLPTAILPTCMRLWALQPPTRKRGACGNFARLRF
jgi:hypothetical protein